MVTVHASVKKTRAWVGYIRRRIADPVPEISTLIPTSSVMVFYLTLSSHKILYHTWQQCKKWFLWWQRCALIVWDLPARFHELHPSAASQHQPAQVLPLTVLKYPLPVTFTVLSISSLFLSVSVSVWLCSQQLCLSIFMHRFETSFVLIMDLTHPTVTQMKP